MLFLGGSDLTMGEIGKTGIFRDFKVTVSDFGD